MSAWSAKFNHLATFLCICVDDLRVACWFRQFTGSSMNALIDRQNPPTFRVQLGCSGFVIIDENGNFITTKTDAFLDYGDRAFYYVEELLHENSASFRNSNSEQSHVAEEKKCTSEPNETDLDASIRKSLPVVGHEKMDREHEIIVECLNRLAKEKSKRALEKVLCEFREHSENEEQLLSQLGFIGGDLSAFKSHADDHKRIIGLMISILEKTAASIAISDIVKVNEVIHIHAERFDTLYAEVLNNASSCVSS